MVNRAQQLELDALDGKFYQNVIKNQWEDALRIAERREHLLMKLHPEREDEIVRQQQSTALARFLVNLEPEDLRKEAQIEISRTFRADVNRLLAEDKLDDALMLQQSQVATRKRIFGDQVLVDAGHPLLFLGALYREKADRESDVAEKKHLLEQAERIFREAALALDLASPTQPSTLVAWHNLASCLTAQREPAKLVESETILRRVLGWRNKTLKDHDHTVSSYLALARNLALQANTTDWNERLTEADHLFKDGEAMLQRIDSSHGSEMGILDSLRKPVENVRQVLRETRARFEAGDTDPED